MASPCTIKKKQRASTKTIILGVLWECDLNLYEEPKNLWFSSSYHGVMMTMMLTIMIKTSMMMTMKMMMTMTLMIISLFDEGMRVRADPSR